MTLQEFSQQVWHAAQGHQEIRLVLKGEPLPRIVQPYGIAQTSQGKVVLVCWQSKGYTRAGAREGYRNLLLTKISELETLNSHFQRRTDFNPTDGQYKDWVFHI